jgi:hypothetical protein
MGTITFTGGNATQQQAIRTAHGSLATALPLAISAAGTGTGFTGWFGTSGTSQQAAVATVLQACAGNLSQNFSYDLTASLPALLHPAVCVLFVNADSSGVTALMWDGFWPTYYLDAPAGSAELALSICHELVVSFNADVTDLLDVDSPEAARALAAVDAAAAARCAANFTGFLSQFLPGT